MVRGDDALPALPSTAAGYPAHTAGFKNRLAEQNESFMNRTYTIDTRKGSKSLDTKPEDFNLAGLTDALNGYFPRTRSGGAVKVTATSSPTKDQGRSSSENSLFGSSKLPQVKQGSHEQKCTQRPWSRTHAELQKFKDALK